MRIYNALSARKIQMQKRQIHRLDFSNFARFAALNSKAKIDSNTNECSNNYAMGSKINRRVKLLHKLLHSFEVH